MNKVALVTGGAVRVGRALAIGLADAGYDVAILYRSSAGPAEEVRREIESRGRRALLIQGDVSNKADVESLAREVTQKLGRLDLLVNSASNFVARPLLEIEEEEWDEVMGVNLKGPFLTVQALAGLLRESRGHVVNLVDHSAIQPWVVRPHHAVSKAGLLHLTRIMARALAPQIRVNAILPGTVLAPEDSTEEQLRRETALTALGTLGSPEDVLRTLLFLEASPFVTGEVIVVDGGRGLADF